MVQVLEPGEDIVLKDWGGQKESGTLELRIELASYP